MKLKCLATIATLYLRSNEESVEGERPPRASVLESRGTVSPVSTGSRADRVQGKTGVRVSFLPFELRIRKTCPGMEFGPP